MDILCGVSCAVKNTDGSRGPSFTSLKSAHTFAQFNIRSGVMSLLRLMYILFSQCYAPTPETTAARSSRTEPSTMRSGVGTAQRRVKATGTRGTYSPHLKK